LRPILRHLRAPDGVHAQVLVEHHEEAVEPALAQPLIVEAREVVVLGALVKSVNIFVCQE
jgi:hypothetical protein